jgi:hypothetical protein
MTDRMSKWLDDTLREALRLTTDGKIGTVKRREGMYRSEANRLLADYIAAKAEYERALLAWSEVPTYVREDAA